MASASGKVEGEIREVEGDVREVEGDVREVEGEPGETLNVNRMVRREGRRTNRVRPPFHVAALTLDFLRPQHLSLTGSENPSPDFSLAYPRSVERPPAPIYILLRLLLVRNPLSDRLHQEILLSRLPLGCDV